MVHTKTFLCCFDLEIGGIFLGWLGIVYNALSLLTLPHMISELYTFHEQFEKLEVSQMGVSKFGGYGSGGYLYGATPSTSFEDRLQFKLLQVLGVVMPYFVFVFYVMVILKLIASIFLLIGTKRRNHQFVLVYLIIEGIFRVLSMITSLIFAPCLLFDIFWIYVSISTFSLYKKFEKQSRRGTSIELTSVNTVVNPLMIQGQGAYGQPMLSNYQENLKMRDANQLPSYDKVVASASTVY